VKTRLFFRDRSGWLAIDHSLFATRTSGEKPREEFFILVLGKATRKYPIFWGIPHLAF